MESATQISPNMDSCHDFFLWKFDIWIWITSEYEENWLCRQLLGSFLKKTSEMLRYAEWQSQRCPSPPLIFKTLEWYHPDVSDKLRALWGGELHGFQWFAGSPQNASVWVWWHPWIILNNWNKLSTRILSRSVSDWESFFLSLENTSGWRCLMTLKELWDFTGPKCDGFDCLNSEGCASKISGSFAHLGGLWMPMAYS